MKRVQAGILAAALLLALSACSARNEWTSDDTYSGQQHREKQERDANKPSSPPPPPAY
jgi:hypothetical protein